MKWLFCFFTFSNDDEKSKFEIIYAEYRKLMLYKAYQILKDEMLAEDAVSEAFMRIYRNISKIEDPHSNKSLSFIFTIVKNASITIYNARKKQPLSIEEYPDNLFQEEISTEDSVLSKISAGEIYQMLSGVKEEYRSVFILKFAHDMSNQQIAGVLKISENNVNVRLHRAKAAIAKLLNERGINSAFKE